MTAGSFNGINQFPVDGFKLVDGDITFADALLVGDDKYVFEMSVANCNGFGYAREYLQLVGCAHIVANNEAVKHPIAVQKQGSAGVKLLVTVNHWLSSF